MTSQYIQQLTAITSYSGHYLMPISDSPLGSGRLRSITIDNLFKGLFIQSSGYLDLQSHQLSLTGNSAINQNLTTTSSPTFNSLTLSSPLSQSYGGLGFSSYTNGSLLIGSGTQLARGQLLGTENRVNVVLGSGYITLSTPQDLTTTSNVTFNYCQLTDLTVTNAALIGGTTVGQGFTAGLGCTAIGVGALDVNVSGTSNVAIGNSSLNSLITGIDNVSIGNSCGSFLTDGSHNVLMGTSAGRLTNATTNVTSLSNSVVIGDAARVSGVSDTNEIVIGYDARGNGSNTTVIGNSSTTSCHIFGTPTFSDATIADGQLLIGRTSDNSLNLASLTGTSNQVTVTPGAGSITLSTPQNIATTSTPQFTRMGIGVAASAASQALLCIGGNPVTFTSANYASIVDSTNGGALVLAKNSTNYAIVQYSNSSSSFVFQTVESGVAFTAIASRSGCVSVGGAVSTNTSLFTQGNTLTGTTQYGFRTQTTANEGCTVRFDAISTQVRTKASSFTLPIGCGVTILDGSVGATSTLTTQIGIDVNPLTVGSTNNFGIRSQLASGGNNRWNFYAVGTAPNYFNGNCCIGTTTVTTGATFNLELGGGTTSPVLGAATADIVNIAAVDKAAGDRRLYIQSELGSGISLGNNRLDFTGGSGTISLVGSDSLSIETNRCNVLKTLNIPTGTPSSASDTGKAGDIVWDSTYIYICTASNTWKRAQILTW